MKKVLATVAALGLVAGVASTASALDFSVKGKYQVEGYSLSNVEAAGGMELTGETGSDAYWMHTMQMLPTMKVNDKITMYGDIRLFKEATFGHASDEGDTTNTTHNGLDINKIYMEYMSPVGKIHVGRTPAGSWMGSFLNSATAGNRIMWWPSFVSSPWSLLLFTQKMSESDKNSVDSDNDKDLYKVSLSHKSENGSAAIAYNHVDDSTSTAEENPSHGKLELYANYKFDNIKVEFESAHVFGETSTDSDRDWDAWGAYLDVSGQFDALNVGAMLVYASGQDMNAAATDDNEALMAATSGLGNDFKPLYILTGDHTGILNQDSVGGTGFEVANNAGVMAYGVHADYKVSDRLTLHGAIAYAEADEIQTAGQDDEYGVEYNVGAAYKLLDNLTYEAHFGYLDTGDFFKSGTTEAEEVTILSHHLTMTF
ncbi:MAG: porin [Desulfobulbaceae bacterium]|nr:porin [Desulfobulbaceae bacterium]